MSIKGLHKQQIAVSLAVVGKWEWTTTVADRLKWRWRDMSRWVRKQYLGHEGTMCPVWKLAAGCTGCQLLCLPGVALQARICTRKE